MNAHQRDVGELTMQFKYQRQFEVASFTHPEKATYVVSQKHDGGWECSCPHWKFRHPVDGCKHIQALLPDLARVIAANPRFGDLADRAVKTVEAVAVRVGEFTFRPKRQDSIEIDAAVPLRPQRKAI